jgi:Zn-finger nucleic acid-binding protein
MAIFELDGVEIDRCLKCRGTWLDAGELDQLARLEDLAPGALTEAVERLRGAKHGGRRCPRCGKAMEVVEAAGVPVDRCPRGDGLWLDAGEMEKLISAGKDGEAGAAARFFEGFFAADRNKGGTP